LLALLLEVYVFRDEPCNSEDEIFDLMSGAEWIDEYHFD